MSKDKNNKPKKLTKKQIDGFRLQLLHLQDELLERLSDSKEGRDGEISLSLNQEEAHVLNQVKRALEKVDEGSYGVCDISSEKIPLARLDVMPYATMTVQAQEQMEKRK